MLNPTLNLNNNVFDADVEQVPIRKGFGQGLLKAGELDERVVGLCADLTESTQMHLFKEKFPQRFVEIGVAEQNLATVASGMAAMGKIPFITSYAMFSPGRNWEQIRTTIAYNDQPVKLAGSHAGISVGPDGGTHQAIEDIALMRVMPNMAVISPCDALEAKRVTLAAARTRTPVYIRLTREKTPIITTEATPFVWGQAQILWEAPGNLSDVVIFATGALVHKTLLVARAFEKEHKAVTVVNIATIKPLDTKTVIAQSSRAGAVVTVEEHQVAGGMGSAIAECLAEHHPVPIEFIGVRDLFGQSGTPAELIEHYGMGEKAIRAAVEKVLKRKAQKISR